VGIAPLNDDEELVWRNLMQLVFNLPRELGDDLQRSCGLSSTDQTPAIPPGRRRLAELTTIPRPYPRVGAPLLGATTRLERAVKSRRTPSEIAALTSTRLLSFSAVVALRAV
jgi:hypothetical protein